MAKKLTSVLGIDIGSQKMKIAEVRMQGKEPVVTALGIADTPPGAVDHTGLYDVDSVATRLKELAQSIGASVQDAVVTIAGQASVLVRMVEAPRMTPSELKEHMQWEISRNVPFAESTIVSDYAAHPLEDAAAQNQDVVLAISPQSAVDTLVAVGKKSGKKLAAIDVEPLSLARLVKSNYDEFVGKTVCVVDMGHKTTSINVYRDGNLMLPRTVPLGGEMISQSIADATGMSPEDAETAKVTKFGVPSQVSSGAGPAQTEAFQPFNPFADDDLGFVPFSAAPPEEQTPGELAAETEGMVAPEPEPEPVAAPAAIAPAGDDPETVRLFNAAAPVMEEFVAEIRRSVDYYRGKGGDVDAILLGGGGALIPGLADFVSRAMGIPAQTIDPFKSIAVNAKKLDPQLVERYRQEFAVAVGNGLHIAY
jgi:type IV pilus assembly protein PilM